MPACKRRELATPQLGGRLRQVPKSAGFVYSFGSHDNDDDDDDINGVYGVADANACGFYISIVIIS